MSQSRGILAKLFASLAQTVLTTRSRTQSFITWCVASYKTGKVRESLTMVRAAFGIATDHCFWTERQTRSFICRVTEYMGQLDWAKGASPHGGAANGRPN